MTQATNGFAKTLVQRLLKSAGVYNRIKRSRLYSAYWRIANPRVIVEYEREVEFYGKLLSAMPHGATIFDIGANQGYKTQIFLQLGAKVVAVDPDASNQQVLRDSFHSFRIFKKPVVVVGKAVSDTAGTATMWMEKPGSALNTLNAKWVETLEKDSGRFGATHEFHSKHTVETVTLEDLFRTYGRPYFIKIDVEGYEAHVLAGLKSMVPMLSFEVNLPQFVAEGVECVRQLEKIAPGGGFNFAPDCIRGLQFPQWVDLATIVTSIEGCADNCIEVFWRAPGTSANRLTSS